MRSDGRCGDNNITASLHRASDTVKASELETPPRKSGTVASTPSTITSIPTKKLVQLKTKRPELCAIRVFKNKGASAITETKPLGSQPPAKLDTFELQYLHRETRALELTAHAKLDTALEQNLHHEASSTYKVEVSGEQSDIPNYTSDSKPQEHNEKIPHNLYQLSTSGLSETATTYSMDITFGDRAKPTTPPPPKPGSWVDALFGILTVGQELLKWLL